ncbi:ESCRT-III subunit protein did4, partial [Spiromyces aspiralis]
TTCKIKARGLVRTRKFMEKIDRMSASIGSLALNLQTMNASQQMAQSVRGAAMAMRSMNGTLNLDSLQRVLMEFEKQSEMMNMKDELVSDTIDEAMEDAIDDEEEESEQIVQQVLDEIGIELKQSLGDVPQGIKSTAEVEETAEDADEVAALQARLDNLRRE